MCFIQDCDPVDMQVSAEGQTLFVKLESGEMVLQSILEICSEKNIISGSIELGIGMLKDFEIGYFNGKEYEKLTVKENAELLSFHGSIAQNDPRLHIHVAIARRNHTVIGGHLFSATADPLVEMQIRVFNSIKLKRELNKKSGLTELAVG